MHPLVKLCIYFHECGSTNFCYWICSFYCLVILVVGGMYIWPGVESGRISWTKFTLVPWWYSTVSKPNSAIDRKGEQSELISATLRQWQIFYKCYDLNFCLIYSHKGIAWMILVQSWSMLWENGYPTGKAHFFLPLYLKIPVSYCACCMITWYWMLISEKKASSKKEAAVLPISRSISLECVKFN